MFYITFKKVPAEYKKIFENAGFSFEKAKLFSKKSLTTKQLDLFKANQGIKAVSNALGKGEEIKLTAIVFDDEEEKDFELSNVTLPPKDKDSGIIGLVDQLAAKASSDSEIVKLESELYSELTNEISDDEDDDESQAFDSDDEEDFEDEDFEDSEAESSYDEDMELSEPTVDDNFDSLFNIPSDPAEGFNSQEAVETAEPVQVQETSAPRPQLVDMSNYINEADLSVSDKDFSPENFEVMAIAKTLGLTDNPRDKYEQNLNNALWASMDASGIRELKQSWIQNIAAEKGQALSELEDEYDSTNSQSIEDEAHGATLEEITGLSAELDVNKSQEKAKADKEINTKKRELADATKAKVDALKAELEKHDEQVLAEFTEKTNTAMQEAISKLEAETEKEKNDLIRTTEDKIVLDRNSRLAKRKVEIIKKLRENLQAGYKAKQDSLTEGVNKLSQAARKASEENLALREAEAKEAQAKDSREKTLALREKEIALKEKKAEEERKMREAELELKQKELAYKSEALKTALENAPEEADTQTSASTAKAETSQSPSPQVVAIPYPYAPYGYAPQGQMPQMPQNPYPYAPYGYVPQGQMPQMPQNQEGQVTSAPFGQASQQPVTETPKPEEKKPQAGTTEIKVDSVKAKKPINNDEKLKVTADEQLSGKEKRRIKIISGAAVMLALSAAIGGAVLNAQQSAGSKPSFDITKTLPSKNGNLQKTAKETEKMEASASSKSSSKKSVKKTKKAEKKSQEESLEDKQKASLKGFKEASYSVYQTQKDYLAATTDEERLEELDNMLKAGDVNTLSYLTKRGSAMARLYLAITNKDTATAFNLWNGLSSAEKKSASSYASSTLAIELYKLGNKSAAKQVMEDNK